MCRCSGSGVLVPLFAICLRTSSPRHSLLLLGFVFDAPGWQFYHPTSRRVLLSKDVTFDESVPFYRLFPYRSAPSPPPPLFLAPGPPLVYTLLPQGPSPSGGAQLGGAGSEGSGPGGEEPGGVEPEGVEPGGAELEGAESGGAAACGAASSGGPAGASPRLSSQQLREWLVRHAHRRSGASDAGGAGDTGAGGAAVTAGAGGTAGTAASSPGCARASGAGVAGTGCVGGVGAGHPSEPGAAGAGGAGVGGPCAGGAGAAGAGAVDLGAGGAGGTFTRDRTSFPCFSRFLLASPLPAPSPYTEQSGGLTERREPASRPVSGTHAMALRPSSVPLCVPLPAPPESSLPEAPESDHARAASPTVSRLVATTVTDPSFESAVASALVTELLDFAAARRLDYTTALVAKSASASPPSVGGECALGTDVLEDT
ncbi:unnamed protein product [Closterium sp. NIES-53]